MKAQEACLSKGIKKRPLPTVPHKCLIASSLSQSKAELVRLQNKRFRLESLSRTDTIDWMEWISETPGSFQGLIDRIKAGDAYLEAGVLEVRTEMGL